MPLPTPNLDDRRFQDLVDDAKRLVQQRCPEWTDHNVSDPGVTLIEAFAQMVDQLIYRLNRVPDRHYVKFLDLLGVHLFPPTAATGTVTFWLAAPQPTAILVRAETEVATPRTDIEEPVVFGTTRRAAASCPASCTASHPAAGGGDVADADQHAGERAGVPCFSERPGAGEALLIGLSNAVPSCAVVLRVECPVGGDGIDPRNPPLVWEAWDGADWTECEVDRDDTGGFNRPGDVVLHVPASHRASLIARQRAGWLRCRIVPAAAHNQPEYTATPRDSRHPRLHDRWHGRHRARRNHPRREYSGSPTARRVSGSSCSAGRSSTPRSPTVLRVSDGGRRWLGRLAARR